MVFEILSPRDESYVKLGFYASLGVPEVIMVEPEARKIEIWKLNAGSYVQLLPTPDGTFVSAQLEVSFRTIAGEPPRLEIADQRDPRNRLSI